MSEPINERRKHVRIDRNFVITYQEKDGSAVGHDISQVNNISLGGMNFSSTHHLKEGGIIDIDLKTPFISDVIRLEGLVLECKEKIPGIIYEIRVKFQKVPDAAAVVLEKIENYGIPEGE